jgi:hypothetical protein
MSDFDVKLLFKEMATGMEYFSVVFLAVGYALVIISAIRHVAKARNGTESMGWVASTMMTIALMAIGPSLGDKVFSIGDEVAETSKFANTDALKTCWDSLLLIVPAESPVADSLPRPKANLEAKPEKGPQQREDSSWTKLAWTWMKQAWVSMTSALDSISGAMMSVANHMFVVLLMYIPAVALLLGMIVVKLGGILRECLHQCMNVFLPMMIAFASFAPLRGAATSFILKYVSIALWPVAWALGNSVALTLLGSVVSWSVRAAADTLRTLPDTLRPLTFHDRGVIAMATAWMPWLLVHVIWFTITICALLLVASAIGAPKALGSMLTTGASFVGAQFQQAGQAVANLASTSAPAPTINQSQSAVLSASLGSARGGAIGSLSAASGRLASLGASGGPYGMLATAAAVVLSRSVQAVSSFGGSAGDAVGSMGAPARVPALQKSGGGQESPSLQLSSPESTRPSSKIVSPRDFRR